MWVYLDQAKPSFLPLGTLKLQMTGLVPARTMSPIFGNISECSMEGADDLQSPSIMKLRVGVAGEGAGREDLLLS